MDLSFQFWIRRSEEHAPFALRFKVLGGRGLLRIAHPEVLTDPPASAAGFEDGLTAEEVRASRFLLVAETGRRRIGYFLAALGDAFLDHLPEGRWVELSPRIAGDMRLLVPSGRAPSSIDSDSVANGSNEEEDLVTNPRVRPISELTRVRSILARPLSEHDPSILDGEEVVLHERSWQEETMLLPGRERTDPSIGEAGVFVDSATEEDARAFLGRTLLASASMFEAPEHGVREAAVAESAHEVPSAASLEEEKEDEDEAQDEPQPEGDAERLELHRSVGPEKTALVRHLRRTVRRNASELERLRARVAELEAALAEVRRHKNQD